MTYRELYQEILKKQSFLCIGLDTDIEKIPVHLKKLDDPVFEFNRQIIDSTHEYCMAYKPNLAFYEALGPEGLMSLKKTIDYIPDDIFVIADAKRSDIGNTSRMYARTYYEYYGCDAITVNPYLGEDSVRPFIEFQDKWTILLGLTSNPGSRDFQMLGTGSVNMFEQVISTSSKWAGMDKLMYVVGATKSEYISRIRKLIPDYFLLVPGIGAQGGDLEAVAKYGLNRSVGLIVNSSRSVIYASDGSDFASAAGEHALRLQTEMARLIERFL